MSSLWMDKYINGRVGKDTNANTNMNKTNRNTQ